MVNQTGWSRFSFHVLVVLSLLTAVLADVLFYEHAVGWTLGGFAGWLVLLILIRHGKAVLSGPMRVLGWATVLMMVGICVSFVLEPGVLAWVLAVIGLGTLAVLSRGGWPSRRLGWSWLRRLINVWAFSLIRPLRDNKLARRWHRRASSLTKTVASAARWIWAVVGIVIPVALSLVFLGLFSIANPVVADWMSRGFEKVGDVFSNLSEYLGIGRIALWYASAFVCWGLLRYRPSRTRRLKLPGIKPIVLTSGQQAAGSTADVLRSAAAEKRGAEQAGAQVGPELLEQTPPHTLSQHTPAPQPIGVWPWLITKYQNLVVRCLVAMNIVFALQLVLDSRYLVMGQQLPEGMTYAQYAHRGAYPLIVTAILAAAMVLAVFRPNGVAQRSVWARRLVLLWIMQNVVLVFSAAWRLVAYVEIYTLTRLRVAAAIWMLMVAGCLFLLLWRIARSRDNSWLTAWAMGWGICVLWVCSFVPFDPMIAYYNVLNCKELGGKAGSIDVGYLEHLGPDTLPALTYLLDNLPQESAAAPPQFEAEAQSREDEYTRTDYSSRTGYSSSSSVLGSRLSLQERLQLIHGRLSRDLHSDLKDWRGWTARRQWLSDKTAG